MGMFGGNNQGGDKGPSENIAVEIVDIQVQDAEKANREQDFLVVKLVGDSAKLGKKAGEEIRIRSYPDRGHGNYSTPTIHDMIAPNKMTKMRVGSVMEFEGIYEDDDGFVSHRGTKKFKHDDEHRVVLTNVMAKVEATSNDFNRVTVAFENNAVRVTSIQELENAVRAVAGMADGDYSSIGGQVLPGNPGFLLRGVDPTDGEASFSSHEAELKEQPDGSYLLDFFGEKFTKFQQGRNTKRILEVLRDEKMGKEAIVEVIPTVTSVSKFLKTGSFNLLNRDERSRIATGMGIENAADKYPFMLGMRTTKKDGEEKRYPYYGWARTNISFEKEKPAGDPTKFEHGDIARPKMVRFIEPWDVKIMAGRYIATPNVGDELVEKMKAYASSQASNNASQQEPAPTQEQPAQAAQQPAEQPAQTAQQPAQTAQQPAQVEQQPAAQQATQPAQSQQPAQQGVFGDREDEIPVANAEQQPSL